MVSGIQAALSGLTALQKKVESSANNTANVNTDGFKKTRVTLNEQQPQQGVRARVETVNTPGPKVYEQTPAGQELVEKSNVELSEELTSQLLSRRFFEANLKTVQTADQMLGSLLDTKG